MGSVSWQVFGFFAGRLWALRFIYHLSGLHRAEVMQQPSLCPWLWGTTPDITLRSHWSSLIDLFKSIRVFQNKRLGSFRLSNWAEAERTILQEIWGTFLVFTGYNAYQEWSGKGCLVPDILQRHHFQLHPIKVEIILTFTNFQYFIFRDASVLSLEYEKNKSDIAQTKAETQQVIWASIDIRLYNCWGLVLS